MHSKLLFRTIPIVGGVYVVVGPTFDLQASIIGSITVIVRTSSNAFEE